MSSPGSTTDSHAFRQIYPVNPDSYDHRTLVESHQPNLRRSARSKAAPTWLRDFVQPRSARVQQASSSSSQSYRLHSTAVYPLFHDAYLSHLSQDFVASFMSVIQVSEPHTYSQAKDSPEWIAAMDRELEALEANGTWSLTTLPLNKKALTSKWVYKVKFQPDGLVERYKARSVIRGFQQVKDKDFKHTFSSVAKLTTVRIFIALATAKG